MSRFVAWLLAWLMPRFDGGGGGSSSSSSSSTTTTNTDKRQVVSEGAVGVSSDQSTVNVTTLDGGAIASSFSFAEKVVTQYLAPSLDVLKSQQEFVKSGGDLVAKAYSDAKGDATTKFLVAVAAGATVAVVGIRFFGKRG